MKNVTKIFKFFCMVMIIIVLPSCSDEEFPTHFSSLNVNREQTFELNMSPGITKASDFLIRFNGSCDINVYVDLPEESGFKQHVVTTGKIENGLLSFVIGELRDEQLMDNVSLFNRFFVYRDRMSGWSGGWGASRMTISPANTRGNGIWIHAYNDGKLTHQLIKEEFFGDIGSLSSGYIYHIYVDRDCTIKSDTVLYPNLRYIFQAFELHLKKGWNTLYRVETYTDGGNALYTMKVRNPGSLSWVMWPVN